MQGAGGLYSIRGTVRGRGSEPIQGARVTVRWQQIRTGTELVAGATAEDGTYQLTYQVPQHPEQPLLLVVEARSEHLDAPLVSSLIAVKSELVVDLALEPADHSEWTAMVGAIRPQLDGLRLSELTDQDISFLATRLGKNREDLTRVALSARLEEAFRIPAAIFYAFLRREKEPVTAPLQKTGSKIFGLTADVQKKTLTEAIAVDLIGPQFTREIPQVVAAMQTLRATELLNQRYLSGNASPAELLNVAAIPQDKHQMFAQAFEANTQPMETFWRMLGNGRSGFTSAEASAIERTYRIGALVDHVVPLVAKLTQDFAAGTFKTLRDLARLSVQDWVQLIGPTALPASVGTAEEFARVIRSRAGAAYPTAALGSRIATDGLATFFKNNDGLELSKQSIPEFLAAQGDKAFEGIAPEDTAQVVTHLRRFQRVLRVAPHPDTAQALLDAGIHSATQIATLGQQQFVAKAALAGIPLPVAAQTFQAASQRYAQVVARYMAFNRDSTGLLPKAIGQAAVSEAAVEGAVNRDPSLATLFGSQDYCATDDCTSILSPAAYLCDLLLWLRNHALTQGTALDVLDSRRPDIRHLLLNCPNTDTELPYIDLVNELLADKISPPTDANSTTNPLWKQTPANKSAEDLRAAPEYFNPGANATLFAASYPFSLPYSAGLDGLRTYLQQSNLPRWQLQQELLPLTGDTVAQEASVAAERFGMAPHALDLVANPDVAAASIVWNTANPLTDLAKLPAFLQAANISYDSLLELLRVAWVQGTSRVAIQGIDDTCATDVQTLSPLDAGFLDRAHRFLRLWRATAYQMWELDMLLGAPAVGNGTLDQTALSNLLAFRQLQDATGLAVDQLLAFYQDIDTAVHTDAHGKPNTSLYARVFLNPSANPFVRDPDFAALALGAPPADPVLSHHITGIQAALGVPAADAATLIALTSGQLALSELSLMYRVKRLAVASKFSISELLQVAAWLPPSPATTLAGAIGDNDTSLQVTSDAGFPAAPFSVKIANEVLLVQSVSGTGNTTWTVARSQNGTLAAHNEGDLVVLPVVRLWTLFASPQKTLARLKAAKAIQQSGFSLDAITYLCTPPPAIYQTADQKYLGPWLTTTQMTEADIMATLSAIRQAALSLLSASTTLAKPISATDTSIQVASGASFPVSNFYISMGAEMLLVTATSGAGNTNWMVRRGQQNTAAAAAGTGTTIKRGRDMDLESAIVAAVASNAHSSSDSPLTGDVAATILNKLRLQGSNATLLETLIHPPALQALLNASGAFTIGGSPAVGDTINAVFSGFGSVLKCSYTLTPVDSGSAAQTAVSFANAINASDVVMDAHPEFRFLAPCTVSGTKIALTVLYDAHGIPAAVPTAFTTAAGVTISRATDQAEGTITIGGSPAQGASLQTVLSDGDQTLTVSYTLGAVDNGSPAQTAANFANAINHSAVVQGRLKFLAPCTVSGATITLHPLISGGKFNATNSAIAGVTVSPAATSTLGQPDFTEQFRAIQLFNKVGVVVRTLRLGSTDLSWLIANAADYGGLDFFQLPVRDTQSALTVSSLMTTVLLVKLARGWTQAPASSPIQSLFDLIYGIKGGQLGNLAAAQNALATITGWPMADVQILATSLGLSFPADYLNPAVYDRLRTLEAMADEAGATGVQIANWGGTPADEPTAENLAADALAALKAKQPTNDAWLKLAPALLNPIRERLSAALEAWLIAQRDASGNPIYGDADGLFDYFLIDTRMSSCQVTSRVVQAYIAVQIFVERCLMNLEPQVAVDPKDDTWSQWQWMKRYRIWEANREVFLYPENWLIESQRPNRTEIYQKLEQEVHQGQATTDHFESVVMNYIGRLDGLAHLVVTGMCGTLDQGLTVVARTDSDPPAYYMRSYTDGAWSGWAEIPLGIKALHVIPAIYRGNVCLFWLDVKVANEPQQEMPAMPEAGNAPTPTPVLRYVTIGVQYSTFRNGSWTPAQSAKGKLFDSPLLDPNAVGDAKSVEALYTLKLQVAGSSTTLIDLVPPGVNETAVANGAGFPAPPFGAYVDSEEITVTAVSGDAPQLWVMTEPFQQAHAAGAPVTGLPGTPTGHDANLCVEVFRLNEISAVATHLGRANFDGRFHGLELDVSQLSHAQSTYGPDAQVLLPLLPDKPLLAAWLQPTSALVPQAGVLATLPADPTKGSPQTVALPPLITAQIPFRLVGPDSDLLLQPGSHPYFFQDTRRCYYIWGNFHPFYHPFTGLFGNQLSEGGFDLLYDPNLQRNPDSIDPSGADVFSFRVGYQPNAQHVNDNGGFYWDMDPVTALLADVTANATSITVANTHNPPASPVFLYIDTECIQFSAVTATTDSSETWTVVRGQQGSTAAAHKSGATVSIDRQFLDFTYGSAFSVYNWELFYHIPLYIAQLLSQNQQFDKAQAWFNYIFNPTLQSSDPVPQRFWIPKPLNNLTGAQIDAQQINKLLLAINQGDADVVNQVERWRQDPFNPFLLADLRPVSYMKSTVMSYLDNLIAWGDNLFASESREALSEATLIYVISSEILGPAPVAVTPPPHADESYDQLEPKLDEFANAMVEIENVIGASNASVAASPKAAGIPPPQTFFFKIPSNAKLLGYWTTVTDRLYKLRHCQNIAGAPLQLALFDAPIDPGLLIAAQSAGVDLSSVLSELGSSVPNYRFAALYPQALEFVNAVRGYGGSLQAALEKSDAGALALLQQTLQQQLLTDGSQVLDWQVELAQSNIDALEQTLALAEQKYEFYSTRILANPAEGTALGLHTVSAGLKVVAAITHEIGAVAAAVPTFTMGVAGLFGSPVATVSDGGGQVAEAGHMTGLNLEILSEIAAIGAELAHTVGGWQDRMEAWEEAAEEAQIQIEQATKQLAGAQLALQIAQQNRSQFQEQIDHLQKQIDFLNEKFTSNGLYDWMVSSLSSTYFQSYQLAYQLSNQVERCYRFELGIQDSSFIQFGYWDNLHKGLLAGEMLSHDLRRLQASYLQQNARRYELSRYVSLAQISPDILKDLLTGGACDFTLAESFFDNDYPGHYNRRLIRASLTVVYPNPGKFDNVKATLTLLSNKVRVGTDTNAGYAENPVGTDPRFVYNYAAVPQRIATGNAQDDPGLFVTAISTNITDQRYLPFENAGAISSWHLEMPQSNNEVDLSTVTDVVIHLYYTAADGGSDFQSVVQTFNQDNAPTEGTAVFSAVNDFPAAWQTFLDPSKDQILTLTIPPSKLPVKTRGKNIAVTSITVLAVGWPPGTFTLAPQAPLTPSTLTMIPVVAPRAGNICVAPAALTGNLALGTPWSFKLQATGASDWRSLTTSQIGDVLLSVGYDMS